MDKDVYKTIKKYKNRLEVAGVTVTKIVLFGSHAKSYATEESDIDLVVISNDLEEMDLWERLCLLGRARMGIKKPMEILGYTEEEYAEKKQGSFIGDEVKSTGIEF